QGLALGGGSEIGEDLRIFVEQFLDVVPSQDLDRRDTVFAVRTVEIKQRTLQALGLGGRGSDQEALELRKLPMTPQELETESFELVRAPGQRISWGEFCHSVTLPNTMPAAQEAPQTAVAGASRFRHANAADKMPFLPCLVLTTFPSPTGAARSSTG